MKVPKEPGDSIAEVCGAFRRRLGVCERPAGRRCVSTAERKIVYNAPTYRPGAKTPAGSKAAFTRRMSGSPGPGSPQTSRPAFTAGAARSITSDPPCRSSSGRSAWTSGATACDSATAARTTPLGACARQRTPVPRSRAAAAMRSITSPTAAGSVAAFSTAAAGSTGKTPRRARSAAPPATGTARRPRAGTRGTPARARHLRPERGRVGVADGERRVRGLARAPARHHHRLLRRRPRAHLEGGLDDHADRPEGADVQLREVVAGDVL